MTCHPQIGERKQDHDLPHPEKLPTPRFIPNRQDDGEPLRSDVHPEIRRASGGGVPHVIGLTLRIGYEVSQGTIAFGGRRLDADVQGFQVSAVERELHGAVRW